MVDFFVGVSSANQGGGSAAEFWVIQWTLVIKNTDKTKSRYNKVNFLVPKFKISLYFIIFATRI